MFSFLSSVVLAVAVASAVVIDTEGLPDSGLDTSSWETGVLPPLTNMYNLHDFHMGAKNFINQTEYAYIRTGVLDEYTYNANLEIWKHIKLRPQIHHGRNVKTVNLTTKIMGNTFSAPFFIAPAAYAGYTNEGGEVNLVKAAGNHSILYSPSIVSSKTTKDIAAARLADQILFRQVYPLADEIVFMSQLAEAEELGFKYAFVTIDNPSQQGLRTRSLRQGGPDSSGKYATDRSLESIMRLQNSTKLTIIPKGIQSWEDAKKAVELGFPAIYISNHGGRLLETAPTAVEVLLEIHANAPEIFDKVEVYADSGVRHGSDIAKLLALGVTAVGVGRPAIFSNAWGVEGVVKMIGMLKRELTTTMMLLGVNCTSQLDRSYINTKVVESWL